MICRTAVELVCRSVDARLSLAERVGLRVHTLFCSPCRRVRGELLHLHRLCQEGDATRTSAGALSSEGRERIAAALQQIRRPNDERFR